MARKLVEQDDSDSITEPPRATFDEEVDLLIIDGCMPLPTLRLVSGRPLWDFGSISSLFTMPPEQLLATLREAGPVHLPGDRGIPSSWQLFKEA